MTPSCQSLFRTVPAAGPPAFSHDLLNPLYLDKRAGAECLNNLVGSEVRMPLPKRPDANPGHLPTVEHVVSQVRVLPSLSRLERQWSAVCRSNGV